MDGLGSGDSNDRRPAVSGLVVAGGRSRRFGEREKALAEVDGTPMLRRVADRLDGVASELVVNCRADQRVGFEAALAPRHTARFAVDPVADRGPLYGLRTGLDAARGEYTIALACDVPGVTPELLAHLVGAAAGCVGAVPIVDGVHQPLCAVYHTESALSACESAVEAGNHRLRDVLGILAPASVSESTVRKFCSPERLESVNRPEQLARE